MLLLTAANLTKYNGQIQVSPCPLFCHLHSIIEHRTITDMTDRYAVCKFEFEPVQVRNFDSSCLVLLKIKD